MTKLLITAIIIMFYVWPVHGQEFESVRDVTIQGVKSSVETRCINGYLFAVVVVQSDKGISVSIEQIFETGTFMFKPPAQPVRCK